MLCLLHLGEAGGLPVTAGVPIVVINQEEYLDVLGEADYLPVTTDVPGTREEKYLDGSGEDDNLPGYIGVSIAIFFFLLWRQLSQPLRTIAQQLDYVIQKRHEKGFYLFN